MLITNALLPDGRLVDVAIAGGRVESVLPAGSRAAHEPSPETVDLVGWLLLPAMVEPHAHLDKSFTAEAVPNPRGDLAGAVEAWIAAAEAGRFDHDDLVVRVRQALDRLLLSGVTAVRSHVNCGDGAAHFLAAVQEGVAAYRDLMHVELVALPLWPLAGPAGRENRGALRRAIEEGVDLVGGCPHLEEDGRGAVEVILDAAVDAGLPADLHVDETLDPGVLTLRDLARATCDRGLGGRVTASHCVSLGVQPSDVQASIAGELADAGVSVVTLPQTNLFLQGRDRPSATPRGLTAIHALRDGGVAVAAGADNVQDPFNLVGRSDPLETASLLVMAAHVLPDDAYEMVSGQGRAVLGLEPPAVEEGRPADFVAIDAPSVRGAIADAPADRIVFRAGRLVASSSSSRTVHR